MRVSVCEGVFLYVCEGVFVCVCVYVCMCVSVCVHVPPGSLRKALVQSPTLHLVLGLLS